jgi:hypothetical protein
LKGALEDRGLIGPTLLAEMRLIIPREAFELTLGVE